jgi:hypothetical protein
MEAGRFGPPDAQPFFTTFAGRFVILAACLTLVLGSAIGSYFLVRAASDTEMKAANLRIVELQNENQKLTADNTDKAVTITDLQSQLKGVQGKLTAIMPTENTYVIQPNQSMIAAGGRLTIGLIGSPTNDGINLNINGKQQMAPAGTVFSTTPDPSTTCQVGVQSFDMFKAVVTASCTTPKP